MTTDKRLSDVQYLKSLLTAHERQLKHAYAHIEHLDRVLAAASAPKTTKENDLRKLQLLTEARDAELRFLKSKLAELQKRSNASKDRQIIETLRSTEGLQRVQRELMKILGEAVLTSSRHEFYERRINNLDTENLLLLLRDLQFTDSAK
jgi:hypothetical protein